MSIFIRQQLSPYCITVEGQVRVGDWTHPIERVLPAMHTPAPTPHGRNSYDGGPDDWGPDEFGYTDFDDYHLAIYGA